MSDKKQLLTESEIRRFMKLANIPAIGTKETLKEMDTKEMARIAHNPSSSDPQTAFENPQEAMAEAGYGMEEEDEAPEAADAGEMVDVGDMAGGDKEAKFEEVVKMLAELIGVDVEVEAGEEGEMDVDVGDEEAGDEEAGEEEEEEEEEEEQEEMVKEEEKIEEKKEEQQLDESLVEAVLARVTSRLVAEAKKKKAAAKKKMTPAEKMKAMKAAKEEKKKKLEEANAPAPKATMSSKEAPKGNGPGKKSFGTGESKDMHWKEGKGEKGHEMKTVSAEGGHTVSHTKTSKLTGQGGNKA